MAMAPLAEGSKRFGPPDEDYRPIERLVIHPERALFIVSGGACAQMIFTPHRIALGMGAQSD